MTLTPRQDFALQRHLNANLYPPVGFMYDCAVAAIACVRDGVEEADAPRAGYVPAPHEITGTRLKGWVNADEVIYNLRLEDFVEGVNA